MDTLQTRFAVLYSDDGFSGGKLPTENSNFSATSIGTLSIKRSTKDLQHFITMGLKHKRLKYTGILVYRYYLFAK